MLCRGLAGLLYCLALFGLPGTGSQRNTEFEECGEKYRAPAEFGSRKVVQLCLGKDGKYCAIILPGDEVKLMEQDKWAKCIPELFEFGRERGLADEKSKACRCIKNPDGTKGPKFEFYKEPMANLPSNDPPPFEPASISTVKPTKPTTQFTTTPPISFWAHPDTDSDACLVKKTLVSKDFMKMESGKMYHDCPETVIAHARSTEPKYADWMTWCSCTQDGKGGVTFAYDGPSEKEFNVIPGKTKDGEPACLVQPLNGKEVMMPLNKKMECHPEIPVNSGLPSKPACSCTSVEPTGDGKTYEWKFKFYKACNPSDCEKYSKYFA